MQGGGGTSLIAAALTLAYWPITYFEARLLNAGLAVFLGLMAMWALLRAAGSGRLRMWIVAGACTGAAAITVPTILAVVPGVMAWIFWVRRARRAHRGCAAAFAAAALACIVPVTVRNAVVGGDVVPIAWSDGMNFYIGNNPQSNGVRAVLPGARADWWGGYEDARDLAQRARGRALKPSEISHYWYGEGLGFWRDHPGAAARLLARKIVLVLGNAEPSNNRQIYFERGRSQVLRALPLGFAVILGLFAVGVVETTRRARVSRRGWEPEHALPLMFALPYLAGVAAFFVTSRYRLPAVAFMLPVAGFAANSLFEHARSRRWRNAGMLAAVFTVICALSNMNPFGVGALADARGNYDLGVDHARSDPKQALMYFERAIAEDADFAPAWRMKGRTLEQIGHFEEARVALLRACELDPRSAESFFLLGKANQKAGRDGDAMAAYEACLRLDPQHKYAWNNMADMLMRAGEPDRAASCLRRALRIDPQFASARYGLGLYYEVTAHPDSALGIYESLGGYAPARRAAERVRRKMESWPHAGE